jgi:hypothetical protein
MGRRLALFSGLMALIALDVRGQDPSASVRGSTSDISYNNYRSAKGPWSIHVVRVPRRNSSFQIHAVHAQGRAVGLGRLSDQVALLHSARELPVAGINGDFYQRGGPYAGDPRGLQIVEGELISAPSGSVSFWIDAFDEPRTTNTVSMFQITWPDGTTTAFGLNGTRRRDGMELYTQAVGPSTRSSGGRELVLEQLENSPWLPLRAGRMYRARVREVRDAGDSRIAAGTMVLSIPPSLFRTTPRVQAGAELMISTVTLPSLRGVKTAISGGPVLVRDGKVQRIRMSDSDSYEYSSMTERHPRSAVGWNDELFFLVEVDGRHRSSVGMTLNELASYLLELGCREAMGLDGGGSATLWCNGRIQNRPCDGYERSIANALVVSKRKESRPPDKAPGGAAAIGRSP